MPIHKVIMPSTSGGTYRTVNMKKVSGRGLEDAILGRGTGSFLLDGGMGGQNSYASLDRYTETTGMSPPLREIKGKGLEKLSAKISGLSITPPKKKKTNIKFEL
jgi:hypothetical protein